MKLVKVAACLAMLVGIVDVVETQEVGKGKKPIEKKADKPATHKVSAKPFKIEVTVTGMLAGEESAEISFQPQVMLRAADGQGTLTIRKLAEHGTLVKKGDDLAALDTTKLNEVIHQLESEQKSLLASLKLAEEELPLAEAAAPIELTSAEHAKKRADQQLKYFLDTDRPQTEKAANMMLKSAKYTLEFAEEELAQLKKMYKANDLTEETERLVLRRQQHYVEYYAFFYQIAIVERDYTFKIALPEREKILRETKARGDLQWDRTSKTSALSLTQKKTALAKQRQEYDMNAGRLDNLVKDRTGMTLRAPMNGIVYHGKFHRGQWSLSEAQKTRFAPGGTVSPDEVFMTIVKPTPTVVYLSVEEKEVHLLKVGATGTVKLTSRPDRKLSAKVSKLSAAPEAPGHYAAQVRLELGKDDADLLPGMACSIKFVAYAKKSAIVIPTKTIHDEDGKDIVFLLTSAGKHEMRTVTRGRSHGDDTEILTGLKEEDEILLERPSAKKEKAGTP